MKQEARSGARVLHAAVLVNLLLAIVGCGSKSTGLSNGVAQCSADPECPSDYHCASDGTCWRNGENPPSPDAGACGKGTLLCGQACVDPKSDPHNCGGCGRACTAGLVCSNGSCQLACSSSEVACDGACVDPDTSVGHCGATVGCGNDGGSAGVACANGQVCNHGACGVSCPTGEIVCGGACVNPMTSAAHCGATGACGDGGGTAGTACMKGSVCVAGSCAVSCPGNQVVCNGLCINPLTSQTHCGASGSCDADGGTAGKACAGGEVCTNGTCVLTCPSGQIDCDGACVDPLTSPAHCGATPGCGVAGAGSAGKACPSGQACKAGSCTVSCPAGEVDCDGACVDPSVDTAHCGATPGCGVSGVGSAGTKCASGELCNAGTCSVSCPGKQVDCNGSCVDPLTDPAHCGATVGCGVNGAGSGGTACPSGEVCNAGACSVSCPGTQINCNGVCVDPTTDPTHCGATLGCGVAGGSAGTACPSGQVCNVGTCDVSCPGTQVNCGGTCVEPSSDVVHCGATPGCGTNGVGSPGTACPSGQVCNTGACDVSCPGSQVNCNGVCVDPSTDPLHCGATAGCGVGGVGSGGTACPSGQVCNTGACNVSCPGTQINCNGICIDPAKDPTYCGATAGCGVGGVGSAGATCANGQVCNTGLCSVSCPGSQVNCNGLCVDPSTDPTHCGATAGCGFGSGSPGTTCGSGQVCNLGTCDVSCPGTQINCNGICVDPTTDPKHCGATLGCGIGGGSAGAACPSGQVCNAGTCDVSCPGTQINCNGVCVDPFLDPIHCGATAGCGFGGMGSPGVACANGEVCNTGACAVSCPGSQVNCNGVCVDPATDPTHCGATLGCGFGGGSPGATCANGEVCNLGTCDVSCPGSQINCNGVCVDPTTDPIHCGATAGCGFNGGSAGSACPSGQVCNLGTCDVSCPGSQINCNGVCVDPTTDPIHCGATIGCGFGGMGGPGVACASGQVCNTGTCAVSCPGSQVNCNGLCVDPATDPKHCGATTGCGFMGGSAGSACANGQVCNAGTCAVSCPGTQVNCNGVCVAPSTDPIHCGATSGCGIGGVGSAGTTCAAGFACTGGTCQPSCPGTEVSCGGACIQPSSDPNYCGASGTCTGAQAGTACTSQQTCSNGLCCATGLVNCGGACIDPASSTTHCGASGTCSGASAGVACGGSQICTSGTCMTPVTGTYTITTSSPVTNLYTNSTCDPNTEFQNDCAGPFGWSWTDVPSGPLLSLTIDFQLEVSCANPGTVHALTLNGTLIGSFTNTIPKCSCVATPQSITIVPSTLSSYVLGGVNTFIISSSTCEGLRVQPGSVIATVTAVYGDPLPVTAGLVADYDARVASSIVKDASNNVTQWMDLSGAGNHLTNNGKSPLYAASLINGRPGLDFGGGAGMFTSAAGFPLAQNVTVFFVTQWRAPGSWGSLAHHGNRDTDWAMEQNALSGNANIVHWQTNNDNSGDQLTLAANTNFILTGRMDTTNGRYFSAYSTAGGLVSTTATLDTIAPGTKQMFVGKSNIGEASNAYFGQMLYYNRSLSDAERDSVIAYLRQSWGL